MLAVNLDLFSISEHSTAQEALYKFEENDHGTLFVIDSDNRVLGSLTDGDIRKILLEKHMLLTPVSAIMNTGFTSVIQGDVLAAKNLFSHYFFLRAIPELDKNGKLVGVFLRELMEL